VQVRVRLANNPNVQLVFSATATTPFSQLQVLSGNNQSAAVNTAFANPIVVQVNNQAQPVSGVAVQFAVTSGSATLGSATATTNAQGQASTTVQAGATAGAVTVTATAGSFTQTINLTVIPPGPALTSESFVNAAGFQRGALSPCGLATIIAAGLAPGVQGAVVPTFIGPLPILVANVSVQFGSSFAPIYSVTNMGGQETVTVQVPCDVTPGTVPVTVRVGAASRNVNVQVQPVSPGIFETRFDQSGTTSDQRRHAVLVRPDGSYVTLQNPARRGEIIRVYVTGLGPTSPAVGTNQVGLGDTDLNVVNPVVVGVNHAGVRVISATYAQNLIGVYEVEFEVPVDVPAGNLPFAVAVPQGGMLVFGNPSIIPVQ
jgi:uncharacterized protein (TIGR03437 family)